MGGDAFASTDARACQADGCISCRNRSGRILLSVEQRLILPRDNDKGASELPTNTFLPGIGGSVLHDYLLDFSLEAAVIWQARPCCRPETMPRIRLLRGCFACG
jgi:hypothetical protein